MRYEIAVLCIFAGCTGAIGEPETVPEVPMQEQPREPTAKPGLEFQCDESADPGPTLTRRLTHWEYANTIEGLLGVEASQDLMGMLPADLRTEGFTNTSSSLNVSLALVETYSALAEVIVSRIPDLNAYVGSRSECQEFNDTCIDSFIRQTSLEFFRRPASDEEVEHMTPIFETVRAEGDSFQVAAGLVVQALLQSPRFLYRTERQVGSDEARDLDSYEVASRLSFLIWQSGPDQTLLDAARSDALDEDGIRTQAARMLAMPAAKEASLRYLRDWLHLDRLDTLARDAERYPTFSSELAQDMKQETLALFENMVWEENRPLTDLYNVQKTIVSKRLATHYGLTEQDEEIAEYDLSDHPERAGILTHASVLTIGGNRSSLVERGVFFLENVLCGFVDSPPQDVVMQMGEVQPGSTQRTYSEIRMENSVCASCHSQMDPLAYGVERFDGIGGYSLQDSFGNDLRQDGGLKVPGNPIEAPFERIDQMVDLVAESDRIRDCMVLKPTQFALGRPLVATDGCMLAEVRDAFEAEGRTYQSLMTAIATHPTFAKVRGQEDFAEEVSE